MRNNLQLILFRLLLLLRCVAQHKCSLANLYFFYPSRLFLQSVLLPCVYIIKYHVLTVDIVRCILCCWCCDCCCLYSLPFQWFACQTKEEEKNSDWMQLLVFQQIFNQTEWKRNEMKWNEKNVIFAYFCQLTVIFVPCDPMARLGLCSFWFAEYQTRSKSASSETTINHAFNMIGPKILVNCAIYTRQYTVWQSRHDEKKPHWMELKAD